jgi:hypothetical protein
MHGLAFHGRISLEDNMIRKNYNIPDFCWRAKR